MNILITGVHGFVGSNLTEALMKDHTIYGVDIVAPEKEGIAKTFSWAGLDAGSLPETDVIIHLAGKAHDTKNQAGAQEYFDINVGLTQRAYEYFIRSSATKFIFFSSVKAVADQVYGEILTEMVVPAPRGPYGESKWQAEQYLKQNWPSDQSEKSVYILRPCMIHGPGNRGNLNLLYEVVQKGMPWPLGAFDNQRSFLSIDNLAYVIGRLIAGDVSSGTYQLADDEPVSTNDLVRLIAASKGSKPKIWQLPKGMVNTLARVGGCLHLPLNPERLHKLTENYVVSNAKIKKALGIVRLPVSAREGLVKTMESFA